MSILKKFFQNEASGGILIICASILALICENTFLTGFYNDFLKTTAGFIISDYKVVKPILLWVNDGLMALFFFYIGLEVKKAILEGELSSLSKVALPAIGGIGGVLVPAFVFLLFTHNNSFFAQGWAIPIVSDTAFAVGVLLLLGKRVPSSLKLFLLMLAIIDDIIAVVSIAIFYTDELSNFALVMASIGILALFLLNILKVNKVHYYLIVGIFLWLSFLESGVHSTIAGIVCAIFIPIKPIKEYKMLDDVMHRSHGFITFFVMPIFAFVNAGIPLNSEAFSHLIHPVPLSIIFGLLIAKPLGIFIFSILAIKLKFCHLPTGANAKQFMGLCILTGIGASMSLFICAIAYQDSDIFFYADKLAILIASFLAAIIGYFALRFTTKVQ